MENIVYLAAENEILAIAPSREAASNIAEFVSYIRNKNAIYTLFGIRLVSKETLLETPEGRAALINFPF